MQLKNLVTISFCKHTTSFLICALLLSSCYTVKKHPVGKPFLFQTSIDVEGGNFDHDERNAVKQRLAGQLEDSSKVVVEQKFLL